MTRMITALMLLLTAVATARAQQPAPGASGGELVDRVIAVVGDTVLLLSDVQGELQQLRASGQLGNDPRQVEQLTQQILETRLSDLILVEAARAAGLTANEDQVNAQVEAGVAEVRQRFASQAEFQSALAQSGLTMEQYRQNLTERTRDEILVAQYVQQRLANRSRPLIDDREVQQFFEAQGAALGERPASVAFRQVVIVPEPSPEAREAAIEETREVLRELQAGGDFEVLARRFSDDTGTAERGGDLGWFGTGRMVPEFERAAFSLRPGQTSGIVESEFGFHIIRVERTRGPERQARHILIRPEITEQDIERARVRADSVAQAIREGASLTTLAARYNQPDDVSTVSRRPIDQLPREYAQALGDAAVNSTIGPVRLADPRGDRWAVIRLTERLEAGPYTLEELRELIVQQLQQQKMVEQILAELRDQIYVRVEL